MLLGNGQTMSRCRKKIVAGGLKRIRIRTGKVAECDMHGLYLDTGMFHRLLR